jgi:hypothetical protein
MTEEELYRKYILEKYKITPESTYLGVNELESLLGLRRDCMENNIDTYDLYPITYEEYTMNKTSFIRPFFSTIKPPLLVNPHDVHVVPLTNR